MSATRLYAADEIDDLNQTHHLLSMAGVLRFVFSILARDILLLLCTFPAGCHHHRPRSCHLALEIRLTGHHVATLLRQARVAPHGKAFGLKPVEQEES